MISPEALTSSLDMRIVTPGVCPESLSGEPPGIPDRQVHVWSGSYADFGKYIPEFPDLVSPGEVARYRSFRKPADACRYLIRHALARVILASYLNNDPRKIRFTYGENGRPEPEPGPEPDGIRFSLSTADALFSLAVSRGLPTGLDIVRTQSRSSFCSISGYLFTVAEQQWIQKEIPSRRYQRFVRIWALKEAILKAAGGNAAMMRDADVSGIVKDSLLEGWYPFDLAGQERQAFIQESASWPGHHQALACLLP